jgi:AAA+ superfamily predicted ATPase
MVKQASLDNTWIEEGLDKLRSKFSNLVFFETEDPERHEQFLKRWAHYDDYHSHTLYQYERWTGLCRYEEKKERFLQVRAGEGDRYAVQTSEKTGMDTGLREVSAALRHMDKELRDRPCIFMLKDMECCLEGCQDRDPNIVSAFRAWSQGSEVGFQRSAVICFCAKTDLVVDEHTEKRAAVIKVDLGKEAERAYVIMQASHELGEHTDWIGKQLGSLVRLTAGLNLHQLKSVLLECYARQGKIDASEVAGLKSDWISREEIVDIVEPEGGFGMVGGYKAVKDFVRKNIIDVLKKPERAARFGAPLPRGVLLFGPPGTGKTLFAKAMAGETNLPFINLRTENLFSRYLGESGRLFGRAIEIAEKNAPAIVFIDEIDRFGQRRSSVSDGASEETRRVFNQILEWLGDKNRQSILVGTTNRPGDLDEALTREGRLDYRIPFLYPDDEARAEILRIHLGLTGSYSVLPESREGLIEEQISWLVTNTAYFSGAELEGLVLAVRRNAFNRHGEFVEAVDFQAAAESFTLNHDQRQREVEKYYAYAQEYTNDASFLNDNA